MAKKIRAVNKYKATRLIEVIWKEREQIVLCVSCCSKRIKANPINKSFYVRPYEPVLCKYLTQLAYGEKCVCADCGRKNENTNLQVIKLNGQWNADRARFNVII